MNRIRRLKICHRKWPGRPQITSVRTDFRRIFFFATFAQLSISFAELLLTSAQNCPHHLALAFDELSSIFLIRNRSSRTDAHHINKPFLIWLNDLTCNYFESNFVIETLPDSSSTFPLDFMRSLNRPEDFESNNTDGELPTVGINIAGSVLNPSTK